MNKISFTVPICFLCLLFFNGKNKQFTLATEISFFLSLAQPISNEEKLSNNLPSWSYIVMFDINDEPDSISTFSY